MFFISLHTTTVIKPEALHAAPSPQCIPRISISESYELINAQFDALGLKTYVLISNVDLSQGQPDNKMYSCPRARCTSFPLQDSPALPIPNHLANVDNNYTHVVDRSSSLFCEKVLF
jgi:hypothetical protein